MVNPFLKKENKNIDLSFMQDIPDAPMSENPFLGSTAIPRATISKAPDERRAPLVAIAERVLPKGVFKSFQSDVVEPVQKVARFLFPTFSDQMKIALEENPHHSTQQLVERAKQLDEEAGLFRAPDGTLVDVTGALGTIEKKVVGGLSKRVLPEGLQQAEHEVITHLMELSQPGKRIGLLDGTTHAYSSSFPEWVPSHLRSNDLFKKVVGHYEAGTTPTGSRQNELSTLR